MDETYRENKPIEGSYDPDCAAACGNGIFVGKNLDGIVAFRGIPFAQPPVGNLRWRDPVPVTASEGVFEAYYNGSSPLQTELESERASFIIRVKTACT